MTSLVIGVSGINTTDNPGPGVAVARSLKESSRLNVKTVGLGYDPNDPGHYLRDYIDTSFLLPFPSKGWRELAPRLRTIKAATGMEVIIPCLDAELPLYLRFQSELQDMGFRLFLPTEEQFALRSKDKLDEVTKNIGCRYPATTACDSIDDLCKTLQDKAEFPVVVKGKYYKAYVVYNLSSAVEKATEIAAEWGFPILVQEHVTGPEINLIGLGDGKGQLCGCVCIKKQTKTDLGKVWTALTIQDGQLIELGRRFCEVTKWQGPFELEVMRVGKDLNLIEINPRFPAWVYFATAVGVNLPQRMLDLIYEGDCERSLEYPIGKHLVRFTQECIGDLDLFHDLITLGGKDVA